MGGRRGLPRGVPEAGAFPRSASAAPGVEGPFPPPCATKCVPLFAFPQPLCLFLVKCRLQKRDAKINCKQPANCNSNLQKTLQVRPFCRSFPCFAVRLQLGCRWFADKKFAPVLHLIAPSFRLRTGRRWWGSCSRSRPSATPCVCRLWPQQLQPGLQLQPRRALAGPPLNLQCPTPP